MAKKPVDLSDEPMEVGPKATIWRPATDSHMARCYGGGFDAATEEAFAARLVACWNACRGLSTESLVAGVIPEMYSTIRMLAEDDKADDPSLGDCGDYTQAGAETVKKFKLRRKELPAPARLATNPDR